MTTLRSSWPATVLNGAAALVLAGSAALMLAWPAAADDAPPPAPEPPPQSIIPPGGIPFGSILAQTGSPAGLLGMPDLSAYGANLLLGQNTAPSAPGEGIAGIYPLNAFRSEYLVPQNVTPAAPGQGVPAPGIGPDADNPGTGRIAFLKRLHAMYAAGELDGALLGQRPLDAWETADGDTAVPIPPQTPIAPPTAVGNPNP